MNFTPGNAGSTGHDAESAGHLRDWHRERATRLEKEQLGRQLEITRSTPDLVATADIDGFLTSLNAAGHRLLGLAAGTDVTRLRLPQLYTAASARALMQTDIPNAVGNGVWHSETVLQGADGEEIPCSQILIAHRDRERNLGFFSLILRDIRPLKQAEKERQALLEQLHHARKMETIGRLAGGIAHDFNNVLTVIVGYTELALAEPGTSDALREDLETILTSARKAARLSHQLLDFSSRQASAPDVLDLNDVIAEARRMLECLMGEEVEIRASLEQTLFHVRIGHSQIEQIILNLAVNARDAMPKGGVLAFRTRNLSLNEVDAARQGLEGPGDYVHLSVSDTGTGIEAEVLDRIFEPFYTTKAFGKGTGLGLASVYGAVRQNGGGIEVHSEVGRGTRFDIYLPRAIAEEGAATQDEPPPVQTAPSQGEHILLVEDNAEIRTLLGRVLLEQGYTVHLAGAAALALEIFEEQRERIGLVVSDIVMPGMDGIDLCERLRAIDPGVRVLLVSGHTDRITALHNLQARQVDLLCKPFPPHRLLREVRRLLGAARGSAADFPNE